MLVLAPRTPSGREGSFNGVSSDTAPAISDELTCAQSGTSFGRSPHKSLDKIRKLARSTISIKTYPLVLNREQKRKRQGERENKEGREL